MRDTTFQTWRAVAGPWAQWIKPSLLAAPSSSSATTCRDSPDVSWLPLGGDTAFIIDLPGVEAIAIGAALNGHLYCPVPLFNTTAGPYEIVSTKNVITALVQRAESLRAHPGGPPAFLLDANRDGGHRIATSGDFDNRWYVFASDLPSEARFIESGIRRLGVVCRKLAPDLHDALARYQQLDRILIDPDSRASSPLPRNRSGIARGLSHFGRVLHRNMDGTFGHRISQG